MKAQFLHPDDELIDTRRDLPTPRMHPIHAMSVLRATEVDLEDVEIDAEPGGSERPTVVDEDEDEDDRPTPPQAHDRSSTNDHVTHEGHHASEESDDLDGEGLLLDRVTLPSASRIPILPPEPEIEPAQVDLEPAPSAWRAFWQKLITMVRRRTAEASHAPISEQEAVRESPPPFSFTRRCVSSRPPPIVRAMHDAVWTLEQSDLDALVDHAARVAAVKKAGPEAYAKARILDALESTSGRAASGISILAIRARTQEISKVAFDEALLDLKSKGLIALVLGDGDTPSGANPASWDGDFTRCVLKAPAARRSRAHQ